MFQCINMMMNLLCDIDVIEYLDLKLSARYPGVLCVVKLTCTQKALIIVLCKIF